jgi:hypothetical protein
MWRWPTAGTGRGAATRSPRARASPGSTRQPPLGSVTPLRTFRHPNGLWCRDYREQLYIGQASQQWQDTACRSKAGHWLPLRS